MRIAACGGMRKVAAAAITIASALSANKPPSRDRHLTSNDFWGWGELWLSGPGGDLPVVMSLTSQMGRRGCHRDGDCEEDCELSEGKHEERKRTGGREGE